MLNVLAAITIGFAPVQPMQPDTPPALPIPAERLSQLKSREDIIATARLADGSPAPERITLPQSTNNAEVFAYMLEHYPLELRDRADFEMPWAWLFIDEQGRVQHVSIVKTSGKAAFDSLSVRALRLALYKPALLDGKAVGLWVPMPVQASYEGLAKRAPKEPPQEVEGPVFTPYTVKPQLFNRDEVSRALVRSYPTALRDKGIGGQVLLWARIETDGSVARTELKTSSGYPELDRAAHEVARVMKFTPARNYDQVVTVWIQLPIVYKTQ